MDANDIITVSTTELRRMIRAEFARLRRSADPGEGRLLSPRAAARAAKCRLQIIYDAVRLPADCPGHLSSTSRGKSHGAAIGERRLISSDDLTAWLARRGPILARSK
jgi:hypothetical protein